MLALPVAGRDRYYVSLGDSLSRNGPEYAGVASRLYRRLIAAQPGIRMVPLAIDGATAATVRFVQIPRLLEMSIAPSVITITLGLNELGRLAAGDHESVIQELRQHATMFLQQLRTISPRGSITLTTLFDPMDGTDQSLAQGVQRWNRAIYELATTHSANVADLYTAFYQHGARAGNPMTSTSRPENRDLYLCAGPDLTPIPNDYGAMIGAEVLLGSITDGGYPSVS